jgi:hypothetical protein
MQMKTAYTLSLVLTLALRSPVESLSVVLVAMVELLLDYFHSRVDEGIIGIRCGEQHVVLGTVIERMSCLSR